MKSLTTKFLILIRRLIVFLDYFFWIIFDFSKFKIVHKKDIKKVLVIHLGAMGELLVLTPVIKTLKHELQAEVHVMVSKGKEEVLSNNPNIKEVFASAGNFESDLERLKKENYDLAVIMWPCFPKISYMCLKAGIPYRIGGFKNVRDKINFFFTRRMLDLRNKHAVMSNLDVVRTIGITNNSPKLEFYISRTGIENGKKLINQHGLSKYIIIHPGFSSSNIKYPSRWWPAERYAKVADALIRKYKYKIVITGNESERKFAEEIFSLSKNKKNLLILNNNLSLDEFAFLISKSGLIIAPGTGIIHLASALNTKIIELMGKESPEEWHPWAKKENYRILFHADVCTECDKIYCRKKTQECMRAITAEEVLNAVDSLLNPQIKNEKFKKNKS